MTVTTRGAIGGTDATTGGRNTRAAGDVNRVKRIATPGARTVTGSDGDRSGAGRMAP